MDKAKLLETTFKVHNLGHVRLVDVMGSDASICQMARVSYGAGTKTVNEDRGLIRYLMRHKHTSPFEGCIVKLHLKMPLFVARQWVRHRTAAMNEVSARYSEMPDEFYVPELDEIQLQSKANKQGSEVGLSEDIQEIFQTSVKAINADGYGNYKGFLEDGVAREMARVVMPQTMYTEFYWVMNLHNLLHFLRLRCDSHAQKQIRDYADVILHQVVSVLFPETYKAFLDYSLNAVTFSAQEMKVLKIFMVSDQEYKLDAALKEQGVSDREIAEFKKKLDQ